MTQFTLSQLCQQLALPTVATTVDQACSQLNVSSNLTVNFCWIYSIANGDNQLREANDALRKRSQISLGRKDVLE